MKPLPPIWNWQSTGENGGIIIGSCESAEELGEMIAKLASHSETETIRISKRRRDYEPMIPIEKMQAILNATGEERKKLISELGH